uniref:DNL-type domain-containing protein n=1 Tax=Clytia hemisphaerica TaxID=252671 RepID=A0A7M5WUC7_9CNID|eukprot:TCONS_00054417-protein
MNIKMIQSSRQLIRSQCWIRFFHHRNLPKDGVFKLWNYTGQNSGYFWMFPIRQRQSALSSRSFYSNFCSTRNICSSATLLEEKQPIGKIEGTLYLEFTCNVCEHRSSKTLSKQAYQSGVVLIRCEGCQNLHLIADNLGWFRDNKVNIEDLMKEKGEEVKQLSVDDLQFVPK